MILLLTVLFLSPEYACSFVTCFGFGFDRNESREDYEPKFLINGQENLETQTGGPMKYAAVGVHRDPHSQEYRKVVSTFTHKKNTKTIEGSCFWC